MCIHRQSPAVLAIASSGQFNHEGRALPFSFAFGADDAVMGFDDILRDEEAVAGGMDIYGLRILTVPALGEETLFIFFGDADARIFHRENEFI